MKKLSTILILTFCLLFALPSFSADSPPKPVAAAAAPVPAPVIAEVDQLKLKVLVQDLTIKQLSYQNTQTQLQQLQTDFQKVQADMQALVQDLYKKAGVKPEDYDLNPQTLAFTKKEPPPAPAPAPTPPPTPPKAAKK